MRNAAVLLFTLSLACACSGPVGPIPGKALEGTPAPWPADWAYTDDIENVLLQTRPDEPYSVTVWIVQVDNQPYIAAGEQDAQWVHYLRANPSVLISVNGHLISARASEATTSQNVPAIILAYSNKYQMTEEDFVDRDGLLFRLDKP